jgi:hypothetical protein
MFLAGKLRPHVSASFPLQQAAQALQVLTSRMALGKVVVTTGRSLGLIDLRPASTEPQSPAEVPS